MLLTESSRGEMSPVRRLRLQIWLVLGGAIALVWLVVLFDVRRNEQQTLHEADLATVSDARVFAEYSRSTIRRLNEVLLDARSRWNGDAASFAEFVRQRQEHIADITFQVAVIGRDGIMLFSNLQASQERVDLSQREHFRVHADAPQQDRLFISNPVKGKVSGKWSIQFTRPIHDARGFAGVLVLSVSPDHFSVFADALRVGKDGEVLVVRDNGQVMARAPSTGSDGTAVVKERPYLRPDAPQSGNLHGPSPGDGIERIAGYHRLPDYGLVFVVGQASQHVLAPHRQYRNMVVTGAVITTVLLLLTALAVLRSLREMARAREALELAKRQADEARAQAEEARWRAERASLAKTTFLSNMSHELRTPLNGIMGLTHLLIRRVSEPRHREQLEKIARASEHLLGVINDILDISKIEAGRLELGRQVFTLAALAENLDNLVGSAAASKGLVFHLDLPPDLAQRRLAGDRLRLEQILLNLTGNALKFTERGSVAVRVSAVREGLSDVQLRFEVRDTGIGIAPELQQQVFNAFEQADASTTRKYGGTGLGLTISRRLVEAMGGTIGLDSSPGVGSTFWFTVTLEQVAAHDEAESPATPPSAEAALRQRHAGARILLAEDEPVNQEVTSELLRHLGLQVEVAEDGQLAVEIAATSRYDLILMDLQMPELNGFDATRAIRGGAGPNASTPILALTANAFEQDRQMCLDAGMNDHVAKPIEPELLFEALLRWLSAPAATTPADRV